VGPACSLHGSASLVGGSGDRAKFNDEWWLRVPHFTAESIRIDECLGLASAARVVPDVGRNDAPQVGRHTPRSPLRDDCWGQGKRVTRCGHGASAN